MAEAEIASDLAVAIAVFLLVTSVEIALVKLLIKTTFVPVSKVIVLLESLYVAVIFCPVATKLVNASYIASWASS